ncbi:signal transduction histidine kinase [Streptomyces sp. B3I7]|uniref:sensor histidine kinase n=1 Tax=Streptomyces sp. B3I7 TaxID=3042269 RepID=UPI00277F8F2A|nr:histidine kinase [Streptomyces sp. B3I7]MDQ0811499.1 signal transduction histidine kinase [Streptomyces sp. B3I7]
MTTPHTRNDGTTTPHTSGAGTTTPHTWGYLADDAPAPPTLRLQLGALQTLCRQTFAVRLAALLVGTPFALANTTTGTPRYAALAAGVLGSTASYAMLRDWHRFGPRVLAHPSLMALDLLFVATLLFTASPASPLAYATVCTPLLSGLLYGWRGTGVFTGLQLVVLVTVFRAWSHHPGAGANTVLLAGFCVAAGIIGVTLRNLVFRFGAAGQALAEVNARLAVAEAVASERARLAREMHDSVAKTLHGLALTAEALAASADHADPGTLKHQATTVAAAARRAATESRHVLTHLRARTDDSPAPTDLARELRSYATDFTARTSIPTTLDVTTDVTAHPHLPPDTVHHLLAITSEALENIRRHARATHVRLTLETTPPDALLLRVEDDGTGIPHPVPPLADLTRSGHFGLLGMAERARALGGGLDIARTPGGGTAIEVRTPAPLAPRKAAVHA